MTFSILALNIKTISQTRHLRVNDTSYNTTGQTHYTKCYAGHHNFYCYAKCREATLQGLPSDNWLGCLYLKWTNALAYFATASVSGENVL